MQYIYKSWVVGSALQSARLPVNLIGSPITSQGTGCGSCREALEAEAAVLCLLAKVEPSQLSFVSDVGGAGGQAQIELVVRDGIEVLLPMAGAPRLDLLNCERVGREY